MTETAVFAGGCFWCLEPLFDQIKGVISVTPGYAGGTVPNPTYEQVCEGNTGHLEVVKIDFDSSLVSYAELLQVFWHNIDPLDPKGQFCDKGDQYLTAIFYVNEQQKELAEKSKEEIAKVLGGQQIYTQIRPLLAFHPAEDYHHAFYRKNSTRYQAYQSCCGRAPRLKELWG